MKTHSALGGHSHSSVVDCEGVNGRARTPTLHLWALFAAVAVTSALTAFVATSNGAIGTMAAQGRNQLVVISEEAERLQAFSRHIRKASLTDPADANVPFIGYLGATDSVEPGTKLEISQFGTGLAQTGLSGQTLEVVSAFRLPPTLQLAGKSSQPIELMLVTGRIAGSLGSPLVRFLAAIERKMPSRLPEHRSL